MKPVSGLDPNSFAAELQPMVHGAWSRGISRPDGPR